MKIFSENQQYCLLMWNCNLHYSRNRINYIKFTKSIVGADFKSCFPCWCGRPCNIPHISSLAALWWNYGRFSWFCWCAWLSTFMSCSSWCIGNSRSHSSCSRGSSRGWWWGRRRPCLKFGCCCWFTWKKKIKSVFAVRSWERKLNK